MRSTWLGLAVAALAVAAGSLRYHAPVMAEPDAGQNTVMAVVTEPFGQALITATSAADGSAPGGYAMTRAADNTPADGSVYCLLVQGSSATVGVHFTSGSQDAMGGYVLYFLQDNGHGQPAADALSVSPLTMDPQVCVPGSADMSLAHSTISVHQAGP
jgi:hypothetical protein